MAKWVLSFGDDLTRGVGKTISSAGEGVIKGIGKWFAGKGATKAVETEEIIAKQSDQIAERMAKIFEDTKGMSEDLFENINKNKSNLIETVQNAKRSLDKTIEKEIQEVAVLEKSNVSEQIKDLGKVNLKNYSNMSKQLDDLQDLIINDPPAAVAFLRNNKSLVDGINKLPSTDIVGSKNLFFVQKSLTDSIERLSRILKADDTALSNVAFINKFLSLSKSGMKTKKEEWIANPKNHDRLKRLLDRDDGLFFKHKEFRNAIIGTKEFEDAIKGDITFGLTKVPTRMSLRGLTPWEKAKNIGIGYPATAAATVTGAMAVFEWFDEHDPKEMSNEAGYLYGSLDSFGVSGKGKIIVNNTKMSLNKINALGVKLEGELKSEPDATVISNCMGDLNKELLNTQTNLSEWGTVIENSDNKEAAENAGIKIKDFVNELNKNLHELGEKIGIDVSYSPVSLEKGIANRGESDITKIQKFLISRGIAINLSGKMDWQTINGLKELERMLSVATGNSYTNIFVNLANQNKLEYKDLVEISKAIK